MVTMATCAITMLGERTHWSYCNFTAYQVTGLAHATSEASVVTYYTMTDALASHSTRQSYLQGDGHKQSGWLIM